MSAMAALPVLLLVPAPYAAVAVAYLGARARREPPPAWARALGAAALLVHLGALVALGLARGRSPFHTASEALSFLAVSVGLLYALLERTSRVAAHGGGFFLAVAVLAGAAVPGLATGTAVAPERDALLAGHVGLALLGTAAVLASGLLAFGYLGAYRRVKAHAIRAGAADSGPSLAGLERLARHASSLAAALLAPALAFGAALAGRETRGGTWLALEIGAMAAQLVMVGVAALLWWTRPARGAVAAWLNLGATLLAAVAFGVVHPLLVRAA
jgi:hypothetical protein